MSSFYGHMYRNQDQEQVLIFILQKVQAIARNCELEDGRVVTFDTIVFVFHKRFTMTQHAKPHGWWPL